MQEKLHALISNSQDKPLEKMLELFIRNIRKVLRSYLEIRVLQVRLSVRSGVNRPDEVRVTTDVDLGSPIQLVSGRPSMTSRKFKYFSLTPISSL